MTKTAKIIAILSALFILVGSFFKTLHWPGANVILVTGLGTGIIFLVLLIATFRGKGSGGFEQFTGIFAAVAIILVLMAFVFKTLHLAGAAKLIWVADVGILLSGIFFLIDGFLEKDPVKWALKFITAFFILILIAMIMLLA